MKKVKISGNDRFADGGITCVDKLEELLNKLSVCIHILNRYRN